ncbi:retrovirus-related Pol polyprotein from type-2 retrotransposable element R2DM [Caerostris darwini]|uniref:Retrovirus-related Pol polyprotein from type-2 retrotransposable element R2DM n=1 Tax=Caerostris darwini TaxID=1538125 RepID=A0AAV4TH99_9ARAC|nr:retrovirus-related Pol polyprotein from type-2 retrotransposable element R2DM [Caerostris darwini]
MSFPSELSLRKHLDGHKRAELRADAPKLSLPVSANKKSRRKRANHRSVADIGEPSVVHDRNAVLAQPVAQEPLSLNNIVPEEDTPGPLSHFIEVLDGLGDHPLRNVLPLLKRILKTLYMKRLSTFFLKEMISVWLLPPPQHGRQLHLSEALLPESCSGNHRSTGVGELFDKEFSEKEVWAALKKAESTAPGPDRLIYHHLQLVQKIPSSWKSSTTILIPKGGDPAEVSNWRPIALSNTSYKTFMKCLASKLSAWCERYVALSFCQKGFQPYDGVLEHNFILQQSIERASGSTTTILTEEGTSAAIPIRSGVKQGCPLSGLLFNIALDPVIRSLQGASELHKVLAFADDLCLIANSPSELQDMLDLLDQQMNRLGLHLNPNKSFAYHLQGFTPVGTRDTSCYVNNHRLISIQEGEFHKFLGKPVGFNAVPNYSSLNALAELGVKPLQS